jgi:hypothetical protein
MKSTKIGNGAKSDQFKELTSSEFTNVAGGHSAAIIGVPFLIGCIIGDALWGDGPTMSAEAWFNRYVK